MPAMGKELEPQLSPDEIAIREVEDYIDKVEHQTEISQQDSPTQNQVAVNQQKPMADVAQAATTQAPVMAKQKITLPLDHNAISQGLNAGTSDSVKWLAEWCVMMIKKYPGRVFYMPSGNHHD